MFHSIRVAIGRALLWFTAAAEREDAPANTRAMLRAMYPGYSEEEFNYLYRDFKTPPAELARQGRCP